jgi:putative tryptophan/tyrosine transport system permease protein
MLQALLDAATTGLPLVPTVLGIYIVFRLRDDFDLTIDGSFVLGAAVLAVLLLDGRDAWLSLAVAMAAAAALGMVTALLHLTLKIPVILAGLIMSIGSYSVSLRVLGDRPSESIFGTDSVLKLTDRAQGQTERDLLTCAVLGAIVGVVVVLVGLLLRTRFGLALRATGVNAPMARSCGVNDRAMLVASLCLANGLAGLSGALVVQNQSFVDVNMGVGTLIAGIGAVLLGDLVVRPKGSTIGRALLAVFLGALLYRLILVVALRLGVPPTDLKGVTAAILVLSLAAERYVRPLLSAARHRLAPRVTTPSSATKGAVNA